ncbi:MAG: phosphoribosyltransferase [Thermostichus sp. DRC_bins_24]
MIEVVNCEPYFARLLSEADTDLQTNPPYYSVYPVRLLDGSILELPLKAFPDGQMAIALLMSNQTPFSVEEKLTPLLTNLARQFNPEAIVGIPTLGLDYARRVARSLGFSQYTALGNSRKFWYEEKMSVPVESITRPGSQKRLYIDPGLVSRVKGKRTVIVDDVINTGGTAAASIELLRRVGAEVVGLVVVLTEGHDWKKKLEDVGFDWSNKVRSLGHIPLFQSFEGAWIPIPSTCI